MAWIRMIALLSSGAVLGLAAFHFVQENSEMVVLDFWMIRSKPLPLGAMVILAFVFGLVFGLFASAIQWLKYRGRTKVLNRKLEDMEKELTRTRNLALTGDVAPVTGLEVKQGSDSVTTGGEEK